MARYEISDEGSSTIIEADDMAVTEYWAAIRHEYPRSVGIVLDAAGFRTVGDADATVICIITGWPTEQVDGSRVIRGNRAAYRAALNGIVNAGWRVMVLESA